MNRPLHGSVVNEYVLPSLYLNLRAGTAEPSAPLSGPQPPEGSRSCHNHSCTSQRPAHSPAVGVEGNAAGRRVAGRHQLRPVAAGDAAVDDVVAARVQALFEVPADRHRVFGAACMCGRVSTRRERRYPRRGARAGAVQQGCSTRPSPASSEWGALADSVLGPVMLFCTQLMSTARPGGRDDARPVRVCSCGCGGVPAHLCSALQRRQPASGHSSGPTL